MYSFDWRHWCILIAVFVRNLSNLKSKSSGRLRVSNIESIIGTMLVLLLCTRCSQVLIKVETNWAQKFIQRALYCVQKERIASTIKALAYTDMFSVKPSLQFETSIDCVLTIYLYWSRAQRQSIMCFFCSLQIVAQKKMVKPLLLKYGKYAGKSTITVCLHTSW